MSKSYQDLEILVAKIQRQLAPDAEIIHNVKLPGRRSETMRQIDVLVRQRIGQYEMLIVLECKDYAVPVDVKGVEEFHGLVADVGAHKGVLVCPRGFSQAAKKRAVDYGLDLYSPVDTDPHKWQGKVTVPVVCDFREAMIAFGISGSHHGPFKIPYDFVHKSFVYDANGKNLGTPIENAITRWNGGRFPIDPGLHEKVPLLGTEPTLVDNGYGTHVPVDLYVSLAVEQKLYFGDMPVEQISGFKDELSGGVITNAFTVGILDPDIVADSWRVIESVQSLAMPPLFTLRGLVGWEA